MPEGTETKVCPLCAETIKAAAKVCPHCRYWQKKWSWQNPQIGTTIWALAGCIVFVGFAVFVEKVFGPKEPFGDHPNEVTVVNSQFSHRISGSNLLVTVVGTLTNHGKFAWKDIGVEAQFLDNSGKLIDVIPTRGDYGGLAVLPHGDVGFRIEKNAARPQADYVTHKTFVRWAKDENAWP